MKNEKIMKKKEVCFLPSLLPTYLGTYLLYPTLPTYPTLPQVYIYIKFYVPYYRSTTFFLLYQVSTSLR